MSWKVISEEFIRFACWVCLIKLKIEIAHTIKSILS